MMEPKLLDALVELVDVITWILAIGGLLVLLRYCG